MNKKDVRELIAKIEVKKKIIAKERGINEKDTKV